MTLIGRLVLRSVTAAGTIGAAAALALAPQPGLASHSAIDEHSNGTISGSSAQAPSAACVAATNSFKAALQADVTEDTTERNLERSGTNTNDPTEDQAEKANFKPLHAAVEAACEPNEATEHEKTRPPATPACTAAKQTLKNFMTSARAEELAEANDGTEGTPADKTEDAAMWAQAKTLFQNLATACGFTQHSWDGDGDHR